MKVLLLGDASNYHSALAMGLTRLGHQVTVASDGSGWMHTLRDIDISRRPGKAGGALLWLRLNTLLARDLRGYDVVHISNPVFLNLRPARVRAIFDKVRLGNGAVFLTMLGADTAYAHMYAQCDPCDLSGWLEPLLADHCRYVYDRVDGAVSALYEYHLAGSKVFEAEWLAYAGIPVEMPRDYMAKPHTGPLRIVCACHKGREAEKGIDKMWPVVQRVAALRPRLVEAVMARNVPFSRFGAVLDEADIVVDQLYSSSPATTALMAMARGKTVVSGGTDDFYDFIREPLLRPIINPEADNLDRLEKSLLALADDPCRIAMLGDMGREFVSAHNEVSVVARRVVDFWERRLC